MQGGRCQPNGIGFNGGAALLLSSDWDTMPQSTPVPTSAGFVLLLKDHSKMAVVMSVAPGLRNSPEEFYRPRRKGLVNSPLKGLAGVIGGFLSIGIGLSNGPRNQRNLGYRHRNDARSCEGLCSIAYPVDRKPCIRLRPIGERWGHCQPRNLGQTVIGAVWHQKRAGERHDRVAADHTVISPEGSLMVRLIAPLNGHCKLCDCAPKICSRVAITGPKSPPASQPAQRNTPW